MAFARMKRWPAVVDLGATEGLYMDRGGLESAAVDPLGPKHWNACTVVTPRQVRLAVQALESGAGHGRASDFVVLGKVAMLSSVQTLSHAASCRARAWSWSVHEALEPGLAGSQLEGPPSPLCTGVSVVGGGDRDAVVRLDQRIFEHVDECCEFLAGLLLSPIDPQLSMMKRMSHILFTVSCDVFWSSEASRTPRAERVVETCSSVGRPLRLEESANRDYTCAAASKLLTEKTPHDLNLLDQRGTTRNPPGMGWHETPFGLESRRGQDNRHEISSCNGSHGPSPTSLASGPGSIQPVGSRAAWPRTCRPGSRHTVRTVACRSRSLWADPGGDGSGSTLPRTRGIQENGRSVEIDVCRITDLRIPGTPGGTSIQSGAFPILGRLSRVHGPSEWGIPRRSYQHGSSAGGRL